MGSSITVRDIDPGDKSWLQREARQVGVSMEEFVRRLIREERTKTERRPKPSEAFARHFGVEHGVDLPPPHRHGHRPASFSGESVRSPRDMEHDGNRCPGVARRPALSDQGPT